MSQFKGQRAVSHHLFNQMGIFVYMCVYVWMRQHALIPYLYLLICLYCLTDPWLPTQVISSCFCTTNTLTQCVCACVWGLMFQYIMGNQFHIRNEKFQPGIINFYLIQLCCSLIGFFQNQRTNESPRSFLPFCASQSPTTSVALGKLFITVFCNDERHF